MERKIKPSIYGVKNRVKPPPAPTRDLTWFSASSANPSPTFPFFASGQFESLRGALLPSSASKGTPRTFPVFPPRSNPNSSPAMDLGGTGETSGDTEGETLQKEETVSGLVTVSGGGIEDGEAEGETVGDI